MRTASRIGLFLAVIVVWAALPAFGAGKGGGCAQGRFVVTTGQDLLGDASEPAVLVLNGSTFAVDGACPTHGSATTRRKGTRLKARWDHCGSVAKLRLQATARDCSVVRGTLRARKTKAAMVAVPSLCGDGIVDAGAGEQCEAGQTCDGGVACTACRCAGAQPLECEVGGYPCTWSEVAADVIERTREIADRAGAVLDAGGSTADAAAVVQGRAPAEIQYDARLVRFRLPGGRPVWLGDPDDLDESSGQSAAAASARVAYRAPSVLSPGKNTKTAYVLDPFAWQPIMAGKTAGVVDILSNVYGYEGHVTYLANSSVDSRIVAVDEFARFTDHNVVYVNTHGGTICEDLSTGAPIPCRTIVAAHQVSSGQFAIAEAAERGVDYLRYQDGSYWVVVSADFFRHRYPGGLKDALVVLDGCKTGATDLESVLTGQNSNFVGWSAGVSPSGSKIVMEQFFAMLAQGRAIAEVYQSMGSAVRDPHGLSGAELTIGPQNIRIRELPRVIDASTGQPLTDDSTIEIEGYVDDDKPDILKLVTEVEGVAAAEGDAYTVHFLIDGEEFASEPLSTFAQPLGDFRWSGTAEFELDFDVSEGQTLEIEVYVELAEGGTSTFSASPKATSEKWTLGRVWRGTFTKVIDIGVATVTLDVDATFERDPDESGTTKHPTFLLKSGTMTWSLQDAGGSCNRSAPTTTTQLGPDSQNQLTFDLTTEPVEYRGIADSAGPHVPLTVTCSDGSDPPVTSMEAGGTWFNAPADQHYPVSPDALSGVYHLNALSYNAWNITKVE
jgi:hypothetical protein